MTISDIWAKRSNLHSSGVLRGSRDMHSHILFGVDDGIPTMEESLAALAYEEELGVREVWCTPHIMEEVPNETSGLMLRFSQLLENYQGPVILHLGAEYMLDNLFLDRLHSGDILTISKNIILVEISSAGPPYGFEKILADVMYEGYLPLLAHPERYWFMKTEEYQRLQQMGVLFQLNIPSLTGFYGKEIRVRAEHLLREGMYSVSGSDCHSIKAIRFQYSDAILSQDILKRIPLLDNII